MSDHDQPQPTAASTPPPVPLNPRPLRVPPTSLGTPLGQNPDDQSPVNGLGGAVEAMLRHPRRVMFHLRDSRPGALIGAMLLAALGCSLVYGLVVGSFSGETQYWAAPVKIAAGLLISALICLPSLYIFSCLSGS